MNREIHMCDYINCKAYIMIFSFILVLFSFITDFYFCQKRHGSFPDLFCQNILILQHCTLKVAC